LSAHHYCGVRMAGCFKYGMLILSSPYMQYPPIKKHSLLQSTTHCCDSPRIPWFKLSVPVLKKITHYNTVPNVTHDTEKVRPLSTPLKNESPTICHLILLPHAFPIQAQ
jgi:hypothetical protein